MSPRVWAAKLDLYVGAFDFSAETSLASGSKSGLGAYKVSYMFPVLSQLEVGLGYTLILSQTLSGDSAYGLDVELAYFPLTPASDVKMQTDNTATTISLLWKPFVLFGYSARQFQSVSTQYNGFVFGLGTERKLNKKFDLKFLARYGDFAGPNDGKATEISLLAGLTFSF